MPVAYSFCRSLRNSAVATLFTILAATAADAGGGACCYPDGDCAQNGELACAKTGGTFLPSAVTCSPNPCEQPGPICGNVVIEPPETCDDGDTQSGDGCNEFCVEEFCGDEIVNDCPALGSPHSRAIVCENCDDGNTTAGDGCNSFCQTEVCGNFFVDAGENCDDGNSNAGDGCNATCQDEFCGDGTANDNGTEQCDDGDTNSGDGCNATCQVEFCGDSITNNCPGFRGGEPAVCEQCDDGNTTAGDGCNFCQTEVCGNGTTDVGESCDDGNTSSGDGCDENCTPTGCGNDIVTSPETCDDGNTSAGDGCNGNCIEEFCGDKTVNDCTPLLGLHDRIPIACPEECDDGNTNSFDGCIDCQLAECGDGFIDLEGEVEDCDDGGTVSGDGCSSTCEDEFCGDNVVNDDNGKTTEECDDGNTSETDQCVACADAECGDGIQNVSDGKFLEQCDDGNTTDGDGCDSDCFTEGGACCHGGTCSDGPNMNETVCSETFDGSFTLGATCQDPGICSDCGNDVVEFSEDCDDGGTATGDGCDELCLEEECWDCGGGGTKSARGQLPEPECVPDEGAACDDEEICSLNDTCDDQGNCVGEPVIIPAACDWVMVSKSANGKGQSRTRGNVLVVGDMCGQTTRVGEVALIQGDVVATATSGRKASMFRAAATVEGDIVTGGGGIIGRPHDTLLPGVAVDEVPGGTSMTQDGFPDRALDATGTSPLSIERVGDCQDALDSFEASADELDDLDDTESLGKVKVPLNGSLTIEATGSLNVIDIDRLIAGDKSTITLDGNGFPDVTFILRVTKKIYIHLQSSLVLTGGASFDRVIIYGKTLCKIGQLVEGGGTVFCPNGKVKVDVNTVWDGVLISGRKRVDLRHSAELTHVPLQVGIPLP